MELLDAELHEKKKIKKLLSKVPEVTIFFWIIKILCTTVGETFSDYLSVNIGLGLLHTTIIMGIVFAVVLYFQFKAKKYIPGIYWMTVVLISVFGTLVTDNLTDGIGVPLEYSTIAFSILLGLTFLFWYLSEKTLSIHSIYTKKREVFYWMTILFTFALGTAVGDLYSEQLGLGYLYTGIAVVAIIACTFLAYKFMKLDAVLAFWVAYIFTRPLGASLGDFLSQPKINGGLGLGATVTSVIFLIPILAIIIFLAVTKCDTKPKTQNIAVNQKKTYRKRKKVMAQTFALICIFVFAGTSGYIWRSNSIAAEADASQATSSKVTFNGQLANFISIENNMLNSINTKNFTSAKSYADKLEHDWDAAEPRLRKMDSTSWTQIDGTLDTVFATVRTTNPDISKCKSAIQNSLIAMNAANNAADSTKVSSQTTSQQASLKGQLNDFITIENNMLASVNSKNFAAVSKKADTLEHDWDTAEPQLRKIDSKTWTQIDGSIDSVLAAARSKSPDASKCKSALQNSLNILNTANE